MPPLPNPTLPHPADVVTRVRNDLEATIDHYHGYTQITRFFSVWLMTFLTLTARGPLDGWNALWSTLTASAWVAWRQQYKTASASGVLDVIDELIATYRAMGKHPSAFRASAPEITAVGRSFASIVSGTTQPNGTSAGSMGTMNNTTSTTANPERTIITPMLTAPAAPPDPADTVPPACTCATCSADPLPVDKAS